MAHETDKADKPAVAAHHAPAKAEKPVQKPAAKPKTPAKTPSGHPEKAKEPPVDPVGEPVVAETVFSEPYPVQQARLAFARLDPRERGARASNCLLNGHPLAEAIPTQLGRFCPHCATYVED